MSRPPGTVPGCPRWGYAVLGAILEDLALSPYWHTLHHQLFTPLTMLATSVGGPHLPDPGPDATVERQKVRLHSTVIGNARNEKVGKSHSRMVSKWPIAAPRESGHGNRLRRAERGAEAGEAGGEERRAVRGAGAGNAAPVMRASQT